MEYFDFVTSKVHGLRIKEIYEAKQGIIKEDKMIGRLIGLIKSERL
jgi:hypothetical protein